MRRSLVVRAFVMCLMVVALLPVVAGANDTYVGGSAGSLKPLATNDIRLESETVQVVVFGAFAEYRVDFKFVNAGATQTLLLGFPFEVPFEEGAPVSIPAGFRVWQGEEELDVAYDTGSDPDIGTLGYYTHKVTFEPGVTMISVSYLASASATVYSRADMTEPAPGTMWWYPYWVHTGAGWAGTIDTSVILFTLTDDALAAGVDEAFDEWVGMYTDWGGTAPAQVMSFTQSGNTFRWRYEDYEPTIEHDVVMPFLLPEEAFGRSVWDEVDASSELVLGEYEYRAWAAFDGSVSSAWAEGVDGSGAGEWVRIPFGEARDVREIRVIPGYQKKPELYWKYNRPKTLEVEFSDGTKTRLDLGDHPGLQRFPVTASGVEWARVTIIDVYRGTTRDETYITEVDFGAGTAPEFGTYEQVMGISPPSSETTDASGGETPDGDDLEDDADSERTLVWIALGVAGALALGGAVVLVVRMMGKKK